MIDNRTILSTASTVKINPRKSTRRYDTAVCAELIQRYTIYVNDGSYSAAAECRRRLKALGLEVLMRAPQTEGGGL
jgi:hypothetical protein